MHIHKLTADHQFIREERVDPILRKPLEPQDSIVVCKHCNRAFIVSSWEYVNNISNEHGGLGNTLPILETGTTIERIGKSEAKLIDDPSEYIKNLINSRFFRLYVVAFVAHVFALILADENSFSGFLILISFAPLATALFVIPFLSWNFKFFEDNFSNMVPRNVAKNFFIGFLVFIISKIIDIEALTGIYILFGYPILIARTIHLIIKNEQR